MYGKDVEKRMSVYGKYTQMHPPSTNAVIGVVAEECAHGLGARDLSNRRWIATHHLDGVAHR